MYKAAWLADQGQSYTKEAAMCRYFAPEVVNWASSEALQIHIGYGLMAESPLQRYFHDARFFGIMLGTA